MTQRQVLRQLAEAGQLRLRDFDDAALARLLRDELITVTGQTVILTDKGRRLATPKKPPVAANKPPRPLTWPSSRRPGWRERLGSSTVAFPVAKAMAEAMVDATAVGLSEAAFSDHPPQRDQLTFCWRTH